MILKLKHVKQQKSTDCGVACICLIADVSRREALAALDLDAKSKSFRTDAKQVRAALRKLRIRMGREISAKSWNRLPQDMTIALLAVNYNMEKNTWHWVVFDASDPVKPILDPRSNGRRSIHKSTRLKSYFRIVRR